MHIYSLRKIEQETAVSQIKINRAIAASAIGKFPASAAAMMSVIPAGVIASLLSRELANLLDALWDACQESKAIANRNSIAEVVIWDESRQTLRAIQ